MANLVSDKKGQIMLLTAFLIIIGVVFYTTILNAMVFSANIPSTGIEISKQDIREVKDLTVSEILTAADLNSSIYTGVNLESEADVRNAFENYINSYINSTKATYAARGASVEIILNNVTFNKTSSTMTVKRYVVDAKLNNFSKGSLIIPMDQNQTDPVKVYGLIYKIVDSSGTALLNSTSIPVWTLLQNSVNGSLPGFYSTIYTDDNASNGSTGNVMYRNYSGGPFLIEANNINDTLRQEILKEAAKKNLKVHKLASNFTYNRSVALLAAPKIAIYPKDDPMTISVMEPYYIHGEVPYTEVNNSDILNGALNNYDILTIPHHLMDNEPSEVIVKIVNWVANGGMTHIQCAGTDTMDDAIEKSSAGPDKPWYGFIGVRRSENIPYDSHDSSKDPRFIKLLDNSTPFNATSWFNNSPPLPYSGLADPGAPYSVLAQTDDINGIFGNTGGLTSAFSFFKNSSQVNPDTNILGYASYLNGTALYADLENPHDHVKDPQLMYLEAPYDNGLVVYIAGHNLADRGGDAERLIFESFFASSIRKNEDTVIVARSINITIRYFDGKVMLEDTFTITIQ